MAAPPRLKDRLFTVLCTLGAFAMVIAGLSRGNVKVAIFGGLFFLGYGVLHSVTRQLTPAARVVTGREADDRERLAHYRATVLTGQIALGAAVVGMLLELLAHWGPGLWIAGTSLGVVAVFVAALTVYTRRR